MSNASAGASGAAPARIPELDGIRGIAIVLVLIWHYLVCLVPADPGSLGRQLLTPLRLTWSGVDLFFVLSGFLIAGILIDNRGTTNFFRTFYVRRVCRIFPLYYLWLAMFGLAAYGIGAGNKWLFDGAMPLWSYATFTQNFFMADRMSWGAHWLAVTWSLAVEEQFYLLLPVAVYFLSPRALPRVLLVMVLAAPILRLAFVAQGNGFAAQVLTPARADALLLGALCAYGIRQAAFKALLQRNIPWMYVLLLAFALGVAALSIANPSTTGASPQAAFRYSLLAGMYSTFLLIAISEKHGIISWIARRPWLARMGIIAYGTYIFHQGILGLAHHFLLGQLPRIRDFADLAVTLGALAASLALAMLSWKYFEKPILRFGHSFRYRGDASPGVPMARGLEAR